MKTPVVDEDVGVAASIRIVNPQSMTKADFVEAAAPPMKCWIFSPPACGTVFPSAWRSDQLRQTTVAGWLLTTIPIINEFTIENGSRELALVREQDGMVTNSVVHTLTRDRKMNANDYADHTFGHRLCALTRTFW
jgi:pilus assembly protein CpaF